MDTLDYLENVLQILISLVPLLGIFGGRRFGSMVFEQIDLSQSVRMEILKRADFLSLIGALLLSGAQCALVILAYRGEALSWVISAMLITACSFCIALWLWSIGYVDFKQFRPGFQWCWKASPLVLSVAKFILVLCLVGSNSPNPIAMPDMSVREWRDNGGHSIKAEIALCTYSHVVLHTHDHRYVVVPRGILCPEDNTYLAENTMVEWNDSGSEMKLPMLSMDRIKVLISDTSGHERIIDADAPNTQFWRGLAQLIVSQR